MMLEVIRLNCLKGNIYMKLLGRKNNHTYYLENEIDTDDIFDPLNDSQLWSLVNFDPHLTLNKDVSNLSEFQGYLEGNGLKVNGNLENLKQRCLERGLDEDGFFNALATELARTGIIIKPITKEEHDTIHFEAGIYNGFDAGVCGIAVTTKKEIRSMYERKYVTKKLLNSALEDLKDELNHISDDCNGFTYTFDIGDKDGNIEDSVGGFYGSDLDNVKDKLQYAIDQF